MEVSKFERMFAKEYISNGFKAWNAYYQLRPNIKKGSAYTLGARLLRRDRVRQYINYLIDERYSSEMF